MKNQKSLRNNDTTKHFRIFTDEKTRDFVKQGKIIGINEIKGLGLSLSIDKKFDKFILFCDFLISCYYRRQAGEKVVVSKVFIAKHIGVSSRTIARYKSISQIFGVQYIETYKKSPMIQAGDEFVIPFVEALEVLVNTYRKEEKEKM